MQKNTLETDIKWQFWIDRGGTFTDVVAKAPDGALQSKKLLSENPEAYEDAALHAIRTFLNIEKDGDIPSHKIHAVKMGTTVATNALLERKGDDTILFITKGMRDIIEIGTQARPDTFALEVKKNRPLYEKVVEVEERLFANGTVDIPLDLKSAQQNLQKAYDEGFRAIAIVLMHAYKYPDHEIRLKELAEKIGFPQISISHEISPLTKIVPRGETTIVDAYLTPILRRYIDRISHAINSDNLSGRLLFMQSSGGLTDAAKFRGRDAILSGPAGGIVGAVHTAKLAGFDKIIGFDMGGTSTDVTHYAGEFEKVYETEVAGVRMRVPMMHIHTVAAGGGSLLRYEDNRFRVGPESAGANPGPVCYRRGGDLAVTDINVCLGKIQADFFPAIFGPDQNLPLDREATLAAFQAIANSMPENRSLEEVAEGFLNIAIEHMAQAIKKISIAQGYDVKNYALNCFGGAGGQHACLVADRLGIKTIFLHPSSGVLSAYGMGLADIRTERQVVIDQILYAGLLDGIKNKIDLLIKQNTKDLMEQGLAEDIISHEASALIRYKGTDTTIKISVSDEVQIRTDFENIHKRLYGFTASDKHIVVDTVTVESFGGRDDNQEQAADQLSDQNPAPHTHREIYSGGGWHQAPVHLIEKLEPGQKITGPAIIVDPTGTIIIELGWSSHMNEYRHIILEKSLAQALSAKSTIEYDPVTLEIFNNLFMSIAEQMGLVLQNTSQSVNVKERLDFSCAIFDHLGDLVANAPHVPVHLGSMDSTIKVLIDSDQNINPGDVFVHNNPYNGGSHLPDITVITPVFDDRHEAILFYVASRAHHEDIGGIAPGSMSPKGVSIKDEGIILDCVKMIDQGEFLTNHIRNELSKPPYPARNIDQNIADLMAQAAANTTGANELKKLITTYGLDMVHAYMGYIQDYAEESVRKVIAKLDDSAFEYHMDNGVHIRLTMTVDKDNRQATIDFAGSSDQRPNNFNAPATITRAAILYVFRCLVADDIPLNAGCMKPIHIKLPSGSLLNPNYPAAVVAGNVETSQAVTNAMFGAVKALAASQGTMNNLTFGNEKYQYYETICSGSPAGQGFAGTAAVHTHMTNTRLTDPEILEHRYPVKLEEFSIDRNSGGRGTWQAGDGITRRIKFLEPMECSILSGHREIPAFGLEGGEPGRLGKNWIEKHNGEIATLEGCVHTSVEKYDIIGIQSPTGGGYGPVLKNQTDKSDK